MKQEFTLEEDGKIKYSWEKEAEDFKDKDFGVVGNSGSQGYILFDNKDKAKAVLDRDIEEVTKTMDVHKEQMDKNEYDEEKFNLIKPLVDAIGKLHNDFNTVKNMPERIKGSNLGKYNKILEDFNTAKAFIIEELSNFNKEYGKFLNYGPAKRAYKFNKEQLEKIQEQKEKLMSL